MKRLYDALIREHFKEDDLMLFLTGPRQVGKTTSALESGKKLANNCFYLNWDDEDHRETILKGPEEIVRQGALEEVASKKSLVIFDEIHKHPDWKNFLKGFYDSYKQFTRMIVTGSARLDIYKKGGDSLMGRYFPYRMHPLTVGECLRTSIRDTEISAPKQISKSIFDSLFQYGGFPMPFLKRNTRFCNRWQRLRKEQLFREDIRDLSKIQDIARLEILAELLIKRTGHHITYSSLAKLIRISVDTVSRWIHVLESFFFCFLVRPWSRNITRSLIKEPKIFLWDWSLLSDPGSRAENFVASHLHKAVHFWTDMGFGNYGLYYLRDLEKREVDFVVTKNDAPWFLIEMKHSDNNGISKSLYYFQECTGAKHAFQIALNKPYVNKDCFEFRRPVIVPAQTLLSQLV